MAYKTARDLAAEAFLQGGGRAESIAPQPKRHRFGWLGWRQELRAAKAGVIVIAAIVLFFKALEGLLNVTAWLQAG